MSRRRGLMSGGGSTGDKPHVIDGVIQDSWDEIIQNISDGHAQDYYHLGDMKLLDVGSEGPLNMQIVGFDVDDLADGSGKAKTSWLSKESMKTGHQWNPNLVKITQTETFTPWVADEENGGYKSNNQNKHSTTANAKFILTPSANGTLIISYKVGSEAKRDKYTVKVNGSVVANAISGKFNWQDYELKVSAETEVIIEVTYSKDGSGSSNGDTAYIKWSGVDVSVNAEIADDQKGNTVIVGQQEGTGTIGGWLNCELRNYYQTIIKPKIVPNVLSAVKLVTKTHPAYRSGAPSAISFTQTTTEDIWIPSSSEMFGSGIYTSWFKDSKSRKKVRVGQTGSSWLGQIGSNRWWLRSPSGDSNAGCVSGSGSSSNYSVSYSGSCVLGFCI